MCQNWSILERIKNYRVDGTAAEPGREVRGAADKLITRKLDGVPRHDVRRHWECGDKCPTRYEPRNYRVYALRR